MGVTSSKLREFQARTGRYLPACTALTDNYFQANKPNNNEAAIFFASLRMALRAMLHCSEDEANEFLIGSCNRSLRSSAALDRFLSKKKKSIVRGDPTTAKIMQVWMTYDRDNSGDLSYKEMQQLVKGLNFSKDLTAEIMRPFKANRLRTITYSEFAQVYSNTMSFKELGCAFEGLKDGQQNFISCETFAKFVREVQGEDWSTDTLQQKLLKMGCVDVEEINEANFVTYLMSSCFGPAVDTKKAQNIYHDMDQNICAYFINSSHNTYLTGDQLTSKSSAQMYRKVLQNGCRCVEVDCWNGPIGQPIVYHGHTRTSRITFRECIREIHENAFAASAFPLIVSLEVHASVTQQDRMAEILRSELGPNLFVPPWEASQSPTFTFSPNKLKYKILIKAKRGEFPIGEVGVDKDEHDVDVSSVELTNTEDNAANPTSPLKKKSTKISPKLSALVSIESSGYKGVKDLFYLQEKQPYHCSSYSEGKAKSIAHENHEAFVRINDTCLSRIFPAGTRVDSSNYSPQPYWECGCQLVALNWQSASSYGWRLNRGFFHDNGCCGYILKPDYLRPLSCPSPREQKWRSLTVEVISGFCLPKSPKASKSDVMDPYVTMFLEGPEVDGRPSTTRKVHNNGFHPVWKDAAFAGRTWTVHRWYMTTLALQVFDHDTVTSDHMLAEAFISLRVLRKGYRQVQLYDKAGFMIPGSFLLCYFDYTQ